MSLQNDLSARHFGAFVLGLLRSDYLGDLDLSPAEFRAQVFSESQMSPEAVDALFEAARGVLATAAHQNANPGLLTELLSETGLSPEHTEAFLGTWSKQRNAVHAALVERASFERKQHALAHVSWRIDVETASKLAGNALNEPVAIVELGLGGNTAGADQQPELVLFEMDVEAARQALDQFTAIQKAIADLV